MMCSTLKVYARRLCTKIKYMHIFVLNVDTVLLQYVVRRVRTECEYQKDS
jgi:hypothetical protein